MELRPTGLASPAPHPPLVPDIFVLAVLSLPNKKPWVRLASPPLLAFVKAVEKISLQAGGRGTGARNGEEV